MSENTGSEPKQTREVSLRGLIGKGYDEFWRTKCRYVVVRGSRAVCIYGSVKGYILKRIYGFMNGSISDVVPKNGFGLIYAYTFRNGKSYVGQTKGNLLKRHGTHLRGSNQEVDVLIKKQEYSLHVLAELPYDELDVGEAYFINLLNTAYPNGYNHTTGGVKSNNLTDDVRKKQSLASIGKPKSEQARHNMSIARLGKEPWNKGMKMSDNWAWNKGMKFEDFIMSEAQERHLKELHKSMIGKPKSEETRRKISQTLTGHKRSKESIEKQTAKTRGIPRRKEDIDKAIQTKIQNGQTTKVINLDTGEIFDSINEAQRAYNCKNIYKVLNGQTKRCGGQRWAKYE